MYNVMQGTVLESGLYGKHGVGMCLLCREPLYIAHSFDFRTFMIVHVVRLTCWAYRGARCSLLPARELTRPLPRAERATPLALYP